MNIVILAAGKGTRMHSDMPKVLQPLAGKPMLQHVVAASRALGAGRIVVVVGHGSAAVREALAGQEGISFAEQPQQRGTGDALRVALPCLEASDPRTLVLLGDVPLITSATLQRFCEKVPGGVGLLSVMMEDPTGYGRIITEHGNVVRIVEQKDATDEELLVREVNTGIMLLPTDRLNDWLSGLSCSNAQGEYYLTDVIAMAAKEGIPVRSFPAPDAKEVMGVNGKAELAAAERVWQMRQAGELLASGVTLADPARLDIRGEVSCGRDVFIDVGCLFEGKVTLGDRVKVGAYCVLRNVSVASDAEILPFSHLDGAEIGESSRIGPFTRLRPGAVLARQTHVGNFCEIKKSTVGEGSKVNHLSYIGDTTMGAHVNIGAGTITCNYDGVHKFQTVIGDDAFIGSDTQLVAPVTVGAGATIGAGTTLTRPAPAGKLTLSRARQSTIEGWKRPEKK